MCDITLINKLLHNSNITVLKLYTNKPACEAYAHTKIIFSDEEQIETMIPYVYRRSHLELQTENEIADYLKKIKGYFAKDKINQWVAEQQKLFQTTSLQKKNIQKQFLNILIENATKEVLQEDLPQNSNPQKVIQNLKDNGINGKGGYIISVLRGHKDNGYKTRYWLLPLPQTEGIVYEKMSSRFKEKSINLLNKIDAFEGKVTTIGLLPDHKFSEIRWDPNVPEDNNDDLTEEEIKQKFQLLTNQRNQQKREVCRHCYRTGERGSIFGIKFFYEGNDKWDESIPETGKDAEKGCIGCPWYDIQEWRTRLQQLINASTKKI